MNNKATFSLFLSPVFSQVSSEDKRIFSLFLEKVIPIAYNCNHVILNIYIIIYKYINIMRGKKDAATFPDKPVS